MSYLRNAEILKSKYATCCENLSIGRKMSKRGGQGNSKCRGLLFFYFVVISCSRRCNSVSACYSNIRGIGGKVGSAPGDGEERGMRLETELVRQMYCMCIWRCGRRR